MAENAVIMTCIKTHDESYQEQGWLFFPRQIGGFQTTLADLLDFLRASTQNFCRFGLFPEHTFVPEPFIFFKKYHEIDFSYWW